MSEKISTAAEQARDFSIIYQVALLSTATAMHPGRPSLELRIRSLQDDLPVALPSSDILRPGYYSDDKCIARIAAGYESALQLTEAQTGSTLRSWAAIEGDSDSPIDLISLVTPNYADPSGFYAMRARGHGYADQPPIYFALAAEGDRIDDQVIVVLPIELRLGAQAIEATHGEDYVSEVLKGRIIFPGAVRSMTDTRASHNSMETAVTQKRGQTVLNLPPFPGENLL
jgi:hypothetical protein